MLWYSKFSDCVNCYLYDIDNVKVVLELNFLSLKEILGGIYLYNCVLDKGVFVDWMIRLKLFFWLVLFFIIGRIV